MTKFLAIEEAETNTLTSVFDTLEEANSYAEMIWDHLTYLEKKRRHVYVLDVTEDDIDPQAIEDAKEYDEPFPWDAWFQGGHAEYSGRLFDSKEIHEKNYDDEEI